MKVPNNDKGDKNLLGWGKYILNDWVARTGNGELFKAQQHLGKENICRLEPIIKKSYEMDDLTVLDTVTEIWNDYYTPSDLNKITQGLRTQGAANTIEVFRADNLTEAAQRLQAFYQQYIGHEAEVLFEKAPRGKSMHGFTKNYIRVELPAVEAREEYDNHLMTVRLGEWNHDKTALKVTLKNG